MAHAAGALVLVDGAQAVPHLPVDVQAIGADFYVFSGHKVLGPPGSGALWARRELLEAMPPFLGGGEMIREVHLRHTTFNDVPWKFEAGTPGHRAPPSGSAPPSSTSSAIGMERVRGPRARRSPRTRSTCCRARCRASASTARAPRPSGPAS